jgi:phosphate transport system substrate-binding protein
VPFTANQRAVTLYTFRRRAITAAVSVTVICASMFTSPAARAVDRQLIETGSSLLYPLFNLWIPAYVREHPGLEMTPQSTGSGTGISQAIDGTVQIGASDAYLSDTIAKQHPTMMNIPLAISSQMVNYNLPDMARTHLHLSGPVLAGIYQRKITDWNDEAIKKLNPGLNLPDHKIVTIHRTDGSGDTFIFTQYLSASTPEWANVLGFGTTISWPDTPGSIGAVGNPGMVNAMKNVPYSIAYVGISFKQPIEDNHLGEAALQNQAGKFVLSSAETVKAAAGELSSKTPANESLSLIFAPGDDSYPIINYEYVIVNAHQTDAGTASEMKAFLSWAISPKQGNAPHFLDQVSFVALPPAIERLSQAQIDEIGTK